jgi:hypothetical protein
MLRLLTLTTVAWALAAAPGCGPPGRVKEETIDVKSQEPVERAKKMLEQYAKGQPLGSEVSTFPQLIEEVRSANPDMGRVLEQGLKELQAMKTGHAAKAREIIQKMTPKAPY